MRLSGADGDLDGDKAESNSITNQRAMIRAFVAADPELAAMPAEEFVDDGYSGSSFERPAVQRMLALCRAGAVSAVVVKDLSRFAREYIDAGTYIEQVFPFLRIRFVSIAEGYDSASCDLDEAAPGIAIRNIANAAYCRDTSVRIQSTLHTKWRRGLRPHAAPPFGYMVDPEDPMRLAPDERFAPTVRRAFELAARLGDPKAVAAALNAEGAELPGVAYRRLGLYGFDKRPEPATRRWTSTNVLKIIGNSVYVGTLVAGKTHRRVMSKRPRDRVPDEQRYVTEGAHPALVASELWEASRACLREKESLKGLRRAPAASPFSNGLVRRAECGHALHFRRREVAESYLVCGCDCAAGDGRRVTDAQIADAVAAALRKAGIGVAAGRAEAQPAGPTAPKPASAAAKLAAYERYAAGRATIEDYRSLAAAPDAGRTAAVGLAAAGWPGGDDLGALASTLGEHRYADVDRKLLRRVVDRVLVHEDGRLEVLLR